MRRVLLFVLLVAAYGSKGAELPAVLMQPAYQHFYNLEFDQALSIFLDRAAQEPNSPEAQNHVAQAVMLRAMQGAGLLDTSTVEEKNPFLHRPKLQMTAEDEKLFLASIDRALELSTARLKQNPHDVPALYSSGVAYGLRANYDLMVRKAWLSALRNFTQSRRLHTAVTDLDPNMTDAYLTQGLHTYIAGSLGFPWKGLAFLTGLRGDKESGIRILRHVAEEGQSNKPDAAALLEAILRREHRAKEAIPYVEDLIRWFPRNYLFRIELAQLYSEIGEKDRSLAVVNEVERLTKKKAPGFGMLSEARLKDLRQSVEQHP